MKSFFGDIFLFLRYFFFVNIAAKTIAAKPAANPAFPGILEFYEKNILPKAQICEQIRIDNLKKFIFRARFYALLMLVLFAVFLYVSDNYSLEKNARQQFVNILFAIAGLSFYWPISILLKFKIKIKTILFGEVFKFLNFLYKAEGSLDAGSYDNFLIMPNYDLNISSTEDLVSGNYNNVNFVLEELHLKLKVQNSKGGSHKKTVFKGLVMKLKFNKNFSGRTILKRDLGRLHNFGYKYELANKHNLQKVELEDVQFENVFEVYSSNQIEARYLLTTSFMERLKGLADFFKTKKIEASFYENNLLIAFDKSRNLFEITSIFREINIAKEINELLLEVQLVMDLIDSLKLSQKTTL